MKNINHHYKPNNIKKLTMNFWLQLLQWLQLLVLSFTRIRKTGVQYNTIKINSTQTIK